MFRIQAVVASVKIALIIQGKHKPQVQHKCSKQYKDRDRRRLALCTAQVGTGNENTFFHATTPFLPGMRTAFGDGWDLR